MEMLLSRIRALIFDCFLLIDSASCIIPRLFRFRDSIRDAVVRRCQVRHLFPTDSPFRLAHMRCEYIFIRHIRFEVLLLMVPYSILQATK